MDKLELRTLQILEELDKEHMPSQRELAQKLNVSLGLVNSFLKRLSNKGFFKLANISKNRIKYILTPKGIAEKTRLTYEYIQVSYQLYKDARKKFRNLFLQFINDNDRKVVFYGVSDFAEIAYLSLQETPIELVSVVDPNMAGRKFFNLIVDHPNSMATMKYDKVLVTTDNYVHTVPSNLKKWKIPDDKIVIIS